MIFILEILELRKWENWIRPDSTQDSAYNRMFRIYRVKVKGVYSYIIMYVKTREVKPKIVFCFRMLKPVSLVRY